VKSSSTDLTPPVEMQQGGESSTCGALQTSEKYSRPRTHLEPIDQTVESRRREVRWNTSRENLPRSECRQSDDGRIYQEQNVGNRTTQNPGGLNLSTHLTFWWGGSETLQPGEFLLTGQTLRIRHALTPDWSPGDQS